MNKVQQLFNKLINEYNLRAITIDNETWYSLNDLPLEKATIRSIISRLNNIDERFVNNNTRIIKNSNINSSDIRNFSTKLNNAGEKFATKELCKYLIEHSRLDIYTKNRYIKLFNKNQIILIGAKETNFLQQLEQALEPLGYKGIKQYKILNYRIDYYIKELNVAIEYDENDHKYYNPSKENIRTHSIKNELKCEFIRVSDRHTDLYNIGFVLKELLKIERDIKCTDYIEFNEDGEPLPF